MYELAKSSREAMKSKARRLCGESVGKVDSSNWSPAEPLNTEKKTGLQPTSGKKCGGGISGAAPAFRADRKPRKAGGRVETKKAGGGSLPSPQEAMDSEARTKNIRVTDTKMPKPEEAAARSGKTPQDVPGRKHGGRAKKNLGGVMEVLSPAYGLVRALQRGGKDQERDAAEQAKGMAMAQMMRKSGGKAEKREARATGGRAKAKGKTNISINILAGGKAPAADMAAPPVPPAPMPAPPMAPPPGPAAPPPAMMPPPMPMPGGQPPMGRKRGGRVSYKDMDAGAGTGDGRLEKTEIQQKKRRA